MMIATMCGFSRMIAVLMFLSCAALEVLSNNFRGGIIMVSPKAGGAAKEVLAILNIVYADIYCT